MNNYFVVKSGNLFQAKLHGFLFIIGVIMLFFLVLVMTTMFYVVVIKSTVIYFGHAKIMVESRAFAIRGLVLLIISIPSFYLIYESSSQLQPTLTVKIVASQWYWNFEVANIMEDPVVIYILPLDELRVGSYRFLEVDNRLVLPTNSLIQFNITSSDVIHRFAMPTLGLKVDATPGLLTVVHANLRKVGTHYGQCREICGINHSFMPMCIEVVPFQSFLYWALIVNW